VFSQTAISAASRQAELCGRQPVGVDLRVLRGLRHARGRDDGALARDRRARPGPCHIRRIEWGILAYGADMVGPKIQPPVSATSSVVRSVGPERCHVAFWIEAL
jgi:hypothetical protein